MLEPGVSDIAATVIFALAIIHTFLVKFFQNLGHRFAKGSISEKFFHILGEVEVVFGIWSFIYLIFLSLNSHFSTALNYLSTRSFTEPAFVFVIMTISASRPILSAAKHLIDLTSRLLPFKTFPFPSLDN